jgi:hypothetical protein
VITATRVSCQKRRRDGEGYGNSDWALSGSLQERRALVQPQKTDRMGRNAQMGLGVYSRRAEVVQHDGAVRVLCQLPSRPALGGYSVCRKPEVEHSPGRSISTHEESHRVVSAMWCWQHWVSRRISSYILWALLAVHMRKALLRLPQLPISWDKVLNTKNKDRRQRETFVRGNK